VSSTSKLWKLSCGASGRGTSPSKAEAFWATSLKPSSGSSQLLCSVALQVRISNPRSAVKRLWVSVSPNLLLCSWGRRKALTLTLSTRWGSSPVRSTGMLSGGQHTC
jgi:hypothetical protein